MESVIDFVSYYAAYLSETEQQQAEITFWNWLDRGWSWFSIAGISCEWQVGCPALTSRNTSSEKREGKLFWFNDWAKRGHMN